MKFDITRPDDSTINTSMLEMDDCTIKTRKLEM